MATGCTIRQSLAVPIAVDRSMSLLKPLEQNRQLRTDNGQQIDNARKEAEALFSPKPHPVPSAPGDQSSAGALGRKPRILSASTPPLPLNRMNAETPIDSELQLNAGVPISQLARAHRERLKEYACGDFETAGCPFGKAERDRLRATRD